MSGIAGGNKMTVTHNGIIFHFIY